MKKVSKIADTSYGCDMSALLWLNGGSRFNSDYITFYIISIIKILYHDKFLVSIGKVGYQQSVEIASMGKHRSKNTRSYCTYTPKLTVWSRQVGFCLCWVGSTTGDAFEESNTDVVLCRIAGVVIRCFLRFSPFRLHTPLRPV